MSLPTQASAPRRTALITGASSGIGAALARKLAMRRYDCVLTARRTDRLEKLASELEHDYGVLASAIGADLADREGTAKLIERVEKLGVTVDILVNNAGFGVYGAFVDQADERIARMLELNLISLTSLTHHYVRNMVARRTGRVLQVASVGAYQPSPRYAVYSATKSYVLSFSQALNRELRGTGVTVTTVCPGLTATEFHEVAAHKKAKWMDLVTMTADEVAEIAVRSMLRGRSVVTAGFVNKLMAVVVKFLPRSWATNLAEMTMRGDSA